MGMSGMSGMSGLSGMVASGAAFDPASYGTPLIIAEADGEMSLTGSDVDSWGRTDGGLIALTQSTEAKKPDYVADDGGGYPTVTFDGGDDFLKSSAQVTLDCSSHTEFAVFSHVIAGGRVSTFAPAGGASSLFISDNFSSGISAPVSYYKYIGLQVATGKKLIRRSIDGGHSTHDIWANGVNVGVENASYTDDPITSDLTYVWLGTYDNETQQFLNGSVYAYLVYCPALSASDAEAVEAYLMSKWGLS